MSTFEDLDTSSEDEDAKVCLVVGNTESISDDSDDEINFYDLHSIRNAYYELLSYSSQLSCTYNDLCNQLIELLSHRNNLKDKIDASRDNVRTIQQKVTNLRIELSVIEHEKKKTMSQREACR